MIIKLHKINMELLKRKNFKKIEIKKKILKTLKNNKNQELLQYLYINSIVINKQNKDAISRQKNLCAFTGRTKFYIKHFRTGRHFANKLAFFGQLHNQNQINTKTGVLGATYILSY
uniref:30S ribosomal protein S14 n=1 Tax=Paramecium gigas TaxID=2709424 RepID=UPI001D01FB49|nr:30S ribosomal protein S14 [Paramecium gigas]QVG61510.1 30S ribosomal protein S14 [Paramecium gigas]